MVPKIYLTSLSDIYTFNVVFSEKGLYMGKSNNGIFSSPKETAQAIAGIFSKENYKRIKIVSLNLFKNHQIKKELTSLLPDLKIANRLGLQVL